MEKLKTYLVGSIQDDSNASDWRSKLTKDLEAMNFEVQDPCKMECNTTLADNVDDQKVMLRNLKRGGQWETFHKVMSNIRQADLTCVNNSKFIIVLYDVSKKIGGTVHEIVEAMGKHIPIYTVIEGCKTDANDWILDLLITSELSSYGTYTNKIFDNFKQLTDFIAEEHKEYIRDFGKFVREEEKAAEEKAKAEAEAASKEEVRS